MKKTKILSVFAVLCAMVLSGCNKNKSSEQPVSSEEPVSSSEPAPTTSVHTHSWDNGTVTTQPTCTQKGVKTYKCSGCNETKTEEVPALGHDMPEDWTVTPATCSAEGKKVKACKRTGCDYKEEEVIEKLPHTFPEDGGCAQLLICV